MTRAALMAGLLAATVAGCADVPPKAVHVACAGAGVAVEGNRHEAILAALIRAGCSEAKNAD